MTLEEYRNQQHEIDLVVFHGIFKTQNAHGGRNVMPRCLSEGVDIFLKSVERQGESGHDVRVSRSAPWMARVGDPVMMRVTVSLFIRKFTPGDVTSRRDVPFAVYSQKQKQRLVSKLPDRCFCFDFAWLVTLNLQHSKCR